MFAIVGADLAHAGSQKCALVHDKTLLVGSCTNSIAPPGTVVIGMHADHVLVDRNRYITNFNAMITADKIRWTIADDGCRV